jgi:large subunit ribosomal protein L18
MTTKRTNRIRRHRRIRAKVSGTAERPRIAVFKSNRWTYAQAVNDASRTTLASVSDRSVTKGTKTERASALGRDLARSLKAKHIEVAVFDKAGFKYHGRVQAVADGLRKGGIRV